MKYLFLLLLFFSVSCKDPSSQAVKISTNESGQEVIQLTLKNGEIITLEDEPGTTETGWIDYTFKDHMNGFFLVKIDAWDEGQMGGGNDRGFILIDEKIGTETPIFGNPHFSPNKESFFIIGSKDDYALEQSIWVYRASNISEYQSFYLGENITPSGKWIHNKKIEVKGVGIEGNTIFLEKASDGRWVQQSQ